VKSQLFTGKHAVFIVPINFSHNFILEITLKWENWKTSKFSNKSTCYPLRCRFLVLSTDRFNFLDCEWGSENFLLLYLLFWALSNENIFGYSLLRQNVLLTRQNAAKSTFSGFGSERAICQKVVLSSSDAFLMLAIDFSHHFQHFE
jgi:hypothetical protein